MFAADANFHRADGEDSTRWPKGLEKARGLEQACEGTRVISV